MDRRLSKKLVQKLLKTNTKDEFKTGTMITFTYNAKDAQTYDRKPLVLVLDVTRTHMFGINLHWAPKKLQLKLLKYFEDKKDFKISKTKLKIIAKVFGPVIRLYIKPRCSKRTVLPELYWKHSINIVKDEFIKL